MHKFRKSLIFSTLQLKLHLAFAFNLYPLPDFATVYRIEMIYILFLLLIFSQEVTVNKWGNGQEEGRCQARERRVGQEKTYKMKAR